MHIDQDNTLCEEVINARYNVCDKKIQTLTCKHRVQPILPALFYSPVIGLPNFCNFYSIWKYSHSRNANSVSEAKLQKHMIFLFNFVTY
jgi:hypothetical protein